MDYYLLIIILLLVLAITDLIVGVSNDAVNFLNSAIGSHVAPRHIILMVASVGVFIGASFSSGMMEIARKGIFNPQFFSFAEVLVIFVAVMLTDIILLDLFNTFGMPTSTTVSVVFELLGASTVVAIFKISQAGEPLSEVGMYINSANALTIISGIFISVGVAFVIGIAIQFISRLLFSFQYERRREIPTLLWSGIALALLSYFLLIKGAKGASFIPDATTEWIQGHTLKLLAITLIGWTILLGIARQLFHVDVLKFVVLFGTFALAMAFASNDLVNFIGVPIAGLESYLGWLKSPVEPDALLMTSLQQPVRTKPYLLIVGGAIMVLTLWLSRKARSVTETEVNLGRQDSGEERFEPIALAQWMVRWTLMLGTTFMTLLPKSWMRQIDKSFQPKQNKDTHVVPAFDLVRASVNLTVASTLISFATSLKLPLSTTYVSFMVAMGSSLADRAWGRNSAVFRITGVLQVISGWLMTALIAFTISGIFGALIYAFRGWAIIPLATIAVFLLYRTYRFHHVKDEARKKRQKALLEQQNTPVTKRLQQERKAVIPFLQNIKSISYDAIDAVINENRDLLRKTKRKLRNLNKQHDTIKYDILRALHHQQNQEIHVAKLALLKFDLEQDLLQSITFIVKACSKHLSNSLPSLTKAQRNSLHQFSLELNHYFTAVSQNFHPEEKQKIPVTRDEKKLMQVKLQQLLDEQLQTIGKTKNHDHANVLYVSLLLELKDLIAASARFVNLFKLG